MWVAVIHAESFNSTLPKCHPHLSSTLHPLLQLFLVRYADGEEIKARKFELADKIQR